TRLEGVVVFRIVAAVTPAGHGTDDPGDSSEVEVGDEADRLVLFLAADAQVEMGKIDVVVLRVEDPGVEPGVVRIVEAVDPASVDHRVEVDAERRRKARARVLSLLFERRDAIIDRLCAAGRCPDQQRSTGQYRNPEISLPSHSSPPL